MLQFFRRIVNSKVGVIVTFVVLVLIALAFASGDVSGLRTQGMAALGGGGWVAKVGGDTIAPNDLATRSQQEVDAVRQQNPQASMSDFLAQNGLAQTLDTMIDGLAMETFGRKAGIRVSSTLVDGQIASIPALQGPDGKFDQGAYRRLLAERHLSDAAVHDDLRRSLYAQLLTLPTSGATQVPGGLALPYASLLLEQRAGEIGFVPSAAMGTGATPTPAELSTFYRQNIARYSLPERRVARYALVTPDTIKARAQPTDAELQAAYKADPARFGAAEKRTIEQVVVFDQAGAASLAAKVKGGQSLADAARAAGLEASTQTDVTKDGYAKTVSATVADAVFAAGKGATVGPVKGPLGYVVAHVDAVRQQAARSFEQARAELLPEVAKVKTLKVMADIHDRLDDALNNNSTFDEVVNDQKLQPQTTPALARGGVDPLNPAAKPDPTLAPITTAAFGAEQGDAPQLVPTAADGSFAVVALGQVVPAAPRPLADVQKQVSADFIADRARAAARGIAEAVLAKVQRGTPLAQALAQSGKSLPPARPLSTTRAALLSNRGGAPAPLAMLFALPVGGARMVAAPDAQGWYIVRLRSITPVDARGKPGVIAATSADLSRSVGQEYLEQFIHAVRAQVGVKTDPAALAKVRADLAGNAGQ